MKEKKILRFNARVSTRLDRYINMRIRKLQMKSKAQYLCYLCQSDGYPPLEKEKIKEKI